MSTILKYDAACRAIAEAKTVDEVREWIDKAAAVREYGRRIKNRKLELDALEIRVQAKRRRGELLREMREDGRLYEGKRKLSSPNDSLTLDELEVSRNESSEEQELAAIDGDSFARLMARCRAYAEAHPEKHSLNPLKPPPESGSINGSRAIMGSRHEPDDSLDYFPTPPWATRALIERVLPALGIGIRDGAMQSAWEPACGEGHIAEVLREYLPRVTATDVFDYGYGGVQDFLEVCLQPTGDKWIITNPPFGDSALHFVRRALAMAPVGVAMFFRSQWAVEGVERYEQIFRDTPPTLFAPFVERVPLCKGRWEPQGSTATAYCWLVWFKLSPAWGTGLPALMRWIPPGCRESLTKPDDAERFTAHPIIKRSRTEAQRDDTALTAAPASMDDESTASAMSSCTHGDGAAVRTMSPKPPQNSDDDGIGIPSFLRVGHPANAWRAKP